MIYNVFISLTCIYRGDALVRQNQQLVATAWLDNQVVNVLSTNVQPDAVGTTKRTMKDGTQQEFPCPQAVISYGENMGGVDCNDQLRQFYMVRLKCRKVYKYIFWFLLELVSTNACILSKEHINPTMSLREYRLTSVKSLIGGYCSRKQPGRVAAAGPVAMTKTHYAKKNKTDSKKGVSRCIYCSSKGIKRETVWYCYTCKIHLCHTGENVGSDCFELYYEQL